MKKYEYTVYYQPYIGYRRKETPVTNAFDHALVEDAVRALPELFPADQMDEIIFHRDPGEGSYSILFSSDLSYNQIVSAFYDIKAFKQDPWSCHLNFSSSRSGSPALPTFTSAEELLTHLRANLVHPAEKADYELSEIFDSLSRQENEATSGMYLVVSDGGGSYGESAQGADIITAFSANGTYFTVKTVYSSYDRDMHMPSTLRIHPDAKSAPEAVLDRTEDGRMGIPHIFALATGVVIELLEKTKMTEAEWLASGYTPEGRQAIVDFAEELEGYGTNPMVGDIITRVKESLARGWFKSLEYAGHTLTLAEIQPTDPDLVVFRCDDSFFRLRVEIEEEEPYFGGTLVPVHAYPRTVIDYEPLTQVDWRTEASGF